MVRWVKAVTSTPAQVVYGLGMLTVCIGNQLTFSDVGRVAQSFGRYCYNSTSEVIDCDALYSKCTAEIAIGTICIWSVPLFGAALAASIIYRLNPRREENVSSIEDREVRQLLRGDD
jgi:hypothetical protein